MDLVLAQPGNIQEAVNLGVRATGAVDLPASATGPVGVGQLVVPTGGGGSATMADLNLTIPQENGGQTDIEMTGATSGAGHDQVLQGLDGGVHRVSAITPVGNGADGEGQTVAGELTGGKGPLTASTEMEVNTPDGNKGPETSPALKGPIQASMVTPRNSQHIPINEAHLGCINLDSDAIKGIRNTRPRSRGNGETFCVYDSESQESR